MTTTPSPVALDPAIREFLIGLARGSIQQANAARALLGWEPVIVPDKRRQVDKDRDDTA